MLPATIFITLSALVGLSVATPVSDSTLQKRTAGVTTRYWDCCKPSCAWPDKANFKTPLKTCDANDNPLSDQNIQSACVGGSAYTCSNQGPVAVSSTLAYGTAAVALSGTTEATTCCACYRLTFNGALAGKSMIVMATNTGYDVGSNQFDLAIPGGGQGAFSGCSQRQYPSTSASVWGQQYGGVSSRAECAALPSRLQAGCNFRFDWMLGVSNPTVDFTPTTCPQYLIDTTGCQRA